MKQELFYAVPPSGEGLLVNNTGKSRGNDRFFIRLILAAVLLLAGMPVVGFGQPPAVYSVSPSVGYPLSVVTITGNNFNTTPADNIVYFGATKATVSAASATSLTVSVPVGATFAPVSVDNTANALTGYSQYPFLPSFNGSGTINFASHVDFPAGTHSQHVVLGDVDGDGKTDIVILDYSGDIITIFRNTSAVGSITAGSFAAGVTFPTGDSPYGMAIGDLDGDGKPDIVVSNSIDGTVSVFLNTSTPGTVSMAPKVDFPIVSGAYPVDVAIGDIDGDGKADIVVIDLGGFNVYVLQNTSGIGVINSGSFAAAVGFATGNVPEGLAIGDIDGDGLNDIVLADRNDNTFSVFLNTSAPGSISMAAQVPVSTGGTSDNPIGVALADFDGDGMLDVAILENGSQQVGVFHNSSGIGSVSFSAPVDLATGTHPSFSIGVGDFNGDGKPDMVAANVSFGNVSVYQNTTTTTGVISFAAQSIFSTGSSSGPNWTAVGDLDGDGRPDVVTANVTGGMSILQNLVNTIPSFINGNWQALTVFENTGAANVSGLLHVSDMDGGQTETWTQYAGPVNGTLTITSATAASGSANITPGGSITYTPAHNYSGIDSFTVQVSDGAATAITTIYVTVVPEPIVSLSGNSSCVTSTLTATTNITPYQVVWNNGTTNYQVTGPSWNGTATTAAANGISGFGLGYITLDASGNIYAIVNNTVVKYPAGSDGSTPGVVVAANGLNNAVAVRLDAVGNIFVADNNEGSGDIAEFPPTSDATTPATIVAQNGLQDPVDVFVDAAGYIYAADVNGYVMKFPPNSNPSTPGTIVAENGLQHPVGVFVDGSGNIYVSDNFVPGIFEFPPTSNSATTGNTIAATGLNTPNGIYVDGLGNLYVADRGNNDIQEYPAGSNGSTNPVIIAGTGTGGAAPTQLYMPVQPVLDANGNLFVADFGNNRIQEFANNISLASLAATAGNYTAAVTTFAGGMTTTNTVVVSLGANVTAVPNQAICNGTTSTVNFSGSGATYQWTNNNSGIGLAASGTGNISFTATDSSNVADSGIIIVMPLVGSCAGAPDTFTIRVNPTPDVSPIPGQALCNNATTTATDFSGIISGTTYAWTNNNSGIGLAASGSGSSIASFTATNGTVAAISGTVTVTPSTATCTGTSQGFRITVNPTPTVAAITDQTLCNNVATTAVSFTGTVSGTTYTWGNNDPGIGLAATGIGSIPSFTVANSTDTSVSATITISPSANGCIGSPKGFSINVNPMPTVAVIPSQSLCNNTATTVVNFVGTVTGTDYTWTNTNTGIGLIATDTGNILPFTAINSTGSAITGTVTVTPSANSCAGIPQHFSITVNPTPTVSAIADQAVCNNAATAAVNFSGAVSGATYTWTNTNTSIGLGASGASDILSFTATNGTGVIDTGIITVTPQAGSCIGVPGSFMIMAEPAPMLNTALIAPAICDGTVFRYLPNSTATGATYAWSSPVITGLSVSSLSGTDSVHEVIVNNTTAPIVDTFAYALAAGGCTNTQNVVVTVNPHPQLSSILTPSAICDGMVFSYSPSSLTGDSSFTWVRSNVPGTGTNGISGSGAIYDTLVNTTGFNVTDTFNYTITSYGCAGSDMVQVTVHPTPVLSSPTTPQAICSGATFNYTPASITPTTTFAWSRAAVTGINPATGAGTNDINETLTNSSTDPLQVAYLYTLSAYGCPAHNENVDIVVNPDPAAGMITTAVASVCSNTFGQNFGAATLPPAHESYAWSATDATVQNVGNTQQYCLVDFTTIGDASVILTATVDSTGCSTQSSYPVTISSGVSMQPYVTYSYGEFVCLENVGNGVTSYQWGYDNVATLDSTILIGQIDQSYVISNPDTVHNYYWVMMEQNGCLKKSYYGGPPTTVTTVNAGMTDVKVYPNPTSNNINVEINSTYAGNVTVELSDMLGQKINTVPAINNKAVMDVSGLASGIYVIVCYSEGIKISAVKFIKE